MSFAAVEREMDLAVERGVFPGAVLLVRDADRAFYLRAFGHRSLKPEVTPMMEDTIFDVSSLTKAFATSVAMMLLVAEKKIDLDDRVTRFFHNFGMRGKAGITFRHLLSHASGFAAWRAFFEEIRSDEQRSGRINFVGSKAAKDYVYQEIQRAGLECETGARAIYSDLGFILLGAVIEAVAATSLDRFCQARIFQPLELRNTGFVDLDFMRIRHLEPVDEIIAPTENTKWRGGVICGTVHDDNAYAMGGVAGHAGLFSSARDLDAMLTHLRECFAGRAATPLVDRGILETFWTLAGTAPSSTWCLGWDTPAPTVSSAGSGFSRHTVGHLGFTGVSVWLDLERERHVILLSNRVHPKRSNEAIRRFRPRIHDLVNEALT